MRMVTFCQPLPGEEAYSTNVHVIRSAKASLAIQVIFTLITLGGVFVPLKPTDVVINEIALLETVSQVIEFIYYIIVVACTGSILTWTRYIDWFVSTPLMLVSTMAFFDHLSSPDTRTYIGDLFDECNPGATLPIRAFNCLMLVYGLPLERRAIGPRAGLTLGSLSFFLSFIILFVHYVKPGPIGSLGLFVFIYIVWGFYGIAATQSQVARNVAYNGLDIVSKNLYGLFLLVYGFTIME